MGAVGAAAAASAASAADSAASAASCRRPAPPPLPMRMMEKGAKCRWTPPPLLVNASHLRLEALGVFFLVFAFSLQCRM